MSLTDSSCTDCGASVPASGTFGPNKARCDRCDPGRRVYQRETMRRFRERRRAGEFAEGVRRATCLVCGAPLPAMTDGLRGQAKTRSRLRRICDKPRCRQDLQLYNKLGIAVGTFSATLDAQGGTCRLCPADSDLVLDHDHRTGRVRGVLCRQCNVALGKLGDSPEGLARAFAYVAGDS